MMPHPERAADENLHNTDGKEIFEVLLTELEAENGGVLILFLGNNGPEGLFNGSIV